MPILNLKKVNNLQKIHPLFLAALILWFSILFLVVFLYGKTPLAAAGTGVISILFMYMALRFLKVFDPGFIQNYKNLILMASVTVFSLLIMVFIIHLPSIPASRVYLFPAGAAGILMSVLASVPAAGAAVIFISFAAAIVSGYSFNYFIVFLAGSLAAVYTGRSIRNRRDLNRCGLYIFLFNLVAIIGVELMSPTSSGLSEILMINVAWGFFSALSSVIIAGGVLPIFENAFNITTNIKLLELGDFNSPLLKRLMLEAPGTYHHSLMVATLAENACEKIGANPLVARVGAYYHDIGKLTNPQYFYENQQGLDYKHDKLKPNISALILKRHVKDGLSLALDYNLDEIIRDMIVQHHGTSLIRFFYDKERNAQPERGEKMEKKEFKYPGPKPQTREAGVIMLADAVEAACRSLEEPTYSRIAGLVEKVVNMKFTEGQLNECGLTLSGLEEIRQNFLYTLSGIYHSRIEYPEDKEERAVE